MTTWVRTDEAIETTPFVVARNAARSTAYAIYPAWCTSDVLPLGAIDNNPEDIPAWCHDGSNVNCLRAVTSNPLTYFFCYLADAPPFDCILLSNIGYPNIMGDPDNSLEQISIDIDDDNDFPAPQHIAGMVDIPVGTKSIFFPYLTNNYSGSLPSLYSAVTYLRVTVMGRRDGAPSLGEIWLGKRQHLPRDLMYPVDKYARIGDSERFTSDSGVITTYTIGKNRAALDTVVTLRESEVAAWQQWAGEMEHGRLPFLWVPSFSATMPPVPQSKNVHIMAATSKDFGITRDQWGTYRLRLQAEETAIATDNLAATVPAPV